jgi:hypothetical protein
MLRARPVRLALAALGALALAAPARADTIAYEQSILQSGTLRAFYPLSETGGTVAHDISENGLNGVYEGTVLHSAPNPFGDFAAAQFGRASGDVQYTGAHGSVWLGTDASGPGTGGYAFGGTQRMTIEFFFRQEIYTILNGEPNDSIGTQGLVDSRFGAVGINAQGNRNGGSGLAAVDAGGGGVNLTYPGVPFSEQSLKSNPDDNVNDVGGAWHHVAIVADSGRNAIYYDGVLFGYSYWPAAGSNPFGTAFDHLASVAGGPDGITLGDASGTIGGGHWLRGEMALVSIDYGAKSAAQVAADYAAELAPPTIPEPASLALACAGAMALALRSRRLRRR